MASLSISGTHLCALTPQIQSHRRHLPPKFTTTTTTTTTNILAPISPLSLKQTQSLHPLSNQLNKPLPSAAAAAAEAVESSSTTQEAAEGEQQEVEEKKMKVVVKGVEKPRLVLKFIWMEKNIGLALDQVIPGYGTVPLSPYYFWPRKDAWEELKSKMEEKPWISQKRVIILLNQATDIINLWQQSGGNL